LFSRPSVRGRDSSEGRAFDWPANRIDTEIIPEAIIRLIKTNTTSAIRLKRFEKFF
jgi:hypothetical protein